MICDIITEKSFDKAVKKLNNNNRWDIIDKLDNIVEKLAKKEITKQSRNHPLKGQIRDVCDIHISGDIILLYRYIGNNLELLNLVDIVNHKTLKDPKYQKQLKKKLKSSYEIKEQLQEGNMENNKIYEAVMKHFSNSTWDGDFFELVTDLIDRVDDYSSDEDIWEALDSGLIYTKDEWTVLEYYCTPQEASWEEAYEQLYEDIYSICNDLVNEDAEEFDEDEVDEEDIEDLI